MPHSVKSDWKNSFGYFCFEDFSQLTLKKQKNLKKLQIANFIGYFPIAGNVTGFLRTKKSISLLKKAHRYPRLVPENAKAMLITQLVRGILEMLFLGSLFLLPDLVFTGLRGCGFAKPEVIRHSRFTVK